MPQCAPCRREGLSRDGGPRGLCWKHSRRRCQICRSESVGEELCPPCQNKARQLWLQSRIGQVISPDTFELGRRRREEKLVQIRHTCYCLGDMLTELVRQIIVVVWGDAVKDLVSSDDQKKVA